MIIIIMFKRERERELYNYFCELNKNENNKTQKCS